MVLVQRRSDNKYCLNKNGHRSYTRRDKWTDNPNECKPYASEVGARWSFYSYIPRPKSCEHFKLVTPTYGLNQAPWKMHKKDCPCIKLNRQKVKASFDAKYKIVNISINVSLK